MQELFGVSMNLIMVMLLAILLPALVVLTVLALRNRIMLKLGLRNIPRRRSQSVLIIFGIMISTLIISAAFGIGDTISYSIRNEAVVALGPIDEIVVSARVDSGDSFGTASYFPYERFEQLRMELDGSIDIDGLTPGIGEVVAAVNTRTSLSEGRMKVAGVASGHLQGFGIFSLVSGEEARMEDLATGEAFINDKAADELEAVAGDELRLFLDGEVLYITVKGVVDSGGLAGGNSTLIVPLERAQAIFGRVGQINSIAVSNRGDNLSGAEHSDDVTRDLRLLFVDRMVASQLKVLLSQEEVLNALERRDESLRGNHRSDMSRLKNELQRESMSEQLISLLADDEVSSEVLDALYREGIHDAWRVAGTLFAELDEFSVIDLKRSSIDQADEASSLVTTFFIILGLFSIMVGILLIFLIFVMLAAARRSEMGMARAVGAKRRDLVQMFVFEGTTYALLAAAFGVLLGLAVSVLMVVVINRFIGVSEEDFRFTHHFAIRSAIVAYSLGMIITLVTVWVSANLVSRMNIVAAIRGLSPTIAVTTVGWREMLIAPLLALRLPFQYFWRSVWALAAIHPRRAVIHLLHGVWAVLTLPSIIAPSLYQVHWRFFKQGWLAILQGVLLFWLGIVSDEAASFRIGVSLIIVGLGLSMQTVLRRIGMRADVRDRMSYTFIGLVLLFFWVLPFNALRVVAGDLDSGIEMFFISGIAMVLAAVCTVMYNADLLLRVLTLATGRIGQLRPVLVTAVAYPMSAKFRTGLTLCMFALVIFTLMVMSILTNVFDISSIDQEIVTGDWDIEGTLNINTPIKDIRQAIDEDPRLRIQDFEAIGGYTTLGVEVRQVGAEEQRWQRYGVRAANDNFLEATNHKLKLIANGFGPTEKGIWQALRDDSSLAVVEALVVPRRSSFGDEAEVSFQLEGLFYEDDEMSPIEIEIREPRTGVIIRLKVIGVLDQLTDSFGSIGFGMITSKASIKDAIPFLVPITTYRFRLVESVDAGLVAQALEASFQENGMETEELARLLEEQAAMNRAFNYIFTGFMALGLLVGIAALGVVSLRAVVERRQQIGVLRAIGYRRRMIQLSFLLESSFIALLGIAIGVGLGTIMSYNIVNDVREQGNIETIRFSIPWIQVSVIIVAAYVFSLVTTFLPARQASRIYPAEALRYE
jgi:putative ABC transport system permease protein